MVEKEIDNKEQNLLRFLHPDLVYNKDYLEIFFNDVTCCLCKGVLIDPTSCSQCENNFCTICTEELNQKEFCPLGCKEGFLKQPFRMLKSTIGKLELACPNQCGDAFLYDRLFEHMPTCKIVTVSCPCCAAPVSSSQVNVKQYYNSLYKVTELEERNKRLEKELEQSRKTISQLLDSQARENHRRHSKEEAERLEKIREEEIVRVRALERAQRKKEMELAKIVMGRLRQNADKSKKEKEEKEAQMELCLKLESFRKRMIEKEYNNKKDFVSKLVSIRKHSVHSSSNNNQGQGQQNQLSQEMEVSRKYRMFSGKLSSVVELLKKSARLKKEGNMVVDINNMDNVNDNSSSNNNAQNKSSAGPKYSKYGVKRNSNQKP